jgi:hypothetical protein
METCRWHPVGGTQCKSAVLMDGFCSRHLKQKCAVCFDPVRSTNSPNTKRLTCGHSYHLRCIITWFEHSSDCPVCRKKQDNDTLVVFKEHIEEKMRKKYIDAIRTLEIEVARLRRRSSNFLSSTSNVV